MADPLVSVLMPVFNGERYVRQAVDSVLAQTYKNFELVVVDDGSTDKSAEIVEATGDERVRVVRKAENSGLAAARNTALDEARGEYIAWLDSDDKARPRRFEAQARLLETRPDVGLCGSWVETFGLGQRRRWRYPTESAELKCRLLFDDPFATSSVMLRKAALESAGGRFDMAFPPAEDYELWERISRQWALANLGTVLADYRIHGNQTSVVHSDKQREAVWRVQERQLAKLGIQPTAQQKATHLRVGVDWCRDGGAEFTQEAEHWLGQLLEANALAGAFPQETFREVIAERWWHVCLAAAHDGWGPWRQFRRSKLSQSRRIGFAKKGKLALKCSLAHVGI